MNDLTEKLDKVRARISAACASAGRAAAEVRLLAVSKLQPPEKIRSLYTAGQRDFGENYVQEAVHKQRQLADLAISWHFIGPLQSNKTREVAEHFSWVQSVDRAKLLRRLAEQRPDHLPPLNICLQVNIDDEDSKAGCVPDDLEALAGAVMMLPRLRLRGLMVIPRPGNHAALAALAKTHADLLARLPALSQQPFDTLSMGMSDDLDAAIAAGSSCVRVGTALFGPRPVAASNVTES